MVAVPKASKATLARRRLASAQRLSDQARECLELDLAGVRHKDIAAKLGVPLRTIYGWRGTQAYRDALQVSIAGARQAAEDIIQRQVSLAAETVVDAVKGTLDARKVKVQLAASQWLLEANGLGPVQRTHNRNENLNLTATVSPEDVAKALERLGRKRG